MWMFYSESKWAKAEDLESAIERLSDEISAIIFSEQHDTIYNMQSIQDYETCNAECEKQVQMFSKALDLCSKFLNGNLSIQKFCRDMINVDMKRFLINIKAFLPQECIIKYNIVDE